MLHDEHRKPKLILKSRWLRRILKLAIWIVVSISLLLVTLSALLFIPAIQKIAVDQTTSLLTSKTQMNASVESVRIAFPKTVRFGNVYLEDQSEDTLVYTNSISIDVRLLPILWKEINIDAFKLEGVTCNVNQYADDSSFNYSPLLKVFSGDGNSKNKGSEWEVGFDELMLKDISLKYASQLNSTSVQLLLSELKIEDNNSDIINKSLDINSIVLGETKLNLIIDDSEVQSISNVKATNKFELPFSIALKKLSVNETMVNVDFTSNRLSLSAFVEDAAVTSSSLDPVDKNIILDDFTANELNVALRILQNEDDQEEPAKIRKSDLSQNANNTFGNFEWSFVVHHAKVTETQYQLDLNNKPKNMAGVDYHHMGFDHFNIEADSIFFDQNSASALLTSLSVKEQSGAELENVYGRISVDNHEISVRDFMAKSPKSFASGSITLTYPALRSIGQEVEQLGIAADLVGSLYLNELRPFTQIVHDYPQLSALGSIEINSFQTSGLLNEIAVDRFDLSFGKSSNLHGSINITGLPGTNLKATYQIDQLQSSFEDYKAFIPDTLVPQGINLPQTVMLTSSGETDLSDISTETVIHTDQGSLLLSGQLERGQISCNLELQDYDLAAILGDSTFGKTNLATQIDGSVFNSSLQRIAADTQLESFDYNGYTYENAEFEVDWNDQLTKVNTIIQDSALIAEIQATIQTADNENHVVATLELEHLALHELNYADQAFNINGSLDIDFEIKSRENFKGSYNGGHITLTDKDNSYAIDTLIFQADINENYTNFIFSSEILEASLTGNTRLDELKDAFIDQLDLFIHLPDSIVSDKDFEFEFNLELKNPDIFTEFLIEDLDEIVLTQCRLTYNDAKDELFADVDIPTLDYKGLLYQNLQLKIDSKKELANAILKIDAISHQIGDINNIEVNSILTPGNALVSARQHDLNDSVKYAINSSVSFLDSIYTIQIEDNIIIGYQAWNIPADNMLQLREGQFMSLGTTLSKGDQTVTLVANEQNVKLELANFNIHNITNILEFDSTFIRLGGNINGYAELFNIFSSPSANGNLEIPKLTLNGDLLGKLTANGAYDDSNDSKFELKLENDTNYLLGTGGTTSMGTTLQTNFALEAKLSQPEAFEPLLDPFIHNLHGNINCRLSFVGTDEYNRFNGNLDFDEFGFTVQAGNTVLTHSGSMVIEDNTVFFKNIEIKDHLKNPLTVKGQIQLGDFSNPYYDIAVAAEKFTVMNSRSEHHPDLYGDLIMDADLQFKGKQSALNVQTSFSVAEGTDINYVMPGKDLELITDKGIVEFIDFREKESTVILSEETSFVGDSIIALVKGIDFTTNLKIDPKANFTLVVDPNSGDYTKFRIMGALQYKYNDSQRGYLTGLVELKEGFYELSFYGLVKKRFSYDPGSTVTWRGDVMDGEINFSARHTVQTNSVGLVSNEIGTYERAMYNQRLPYDVILKVRDKISYPEVSFHIDLPQKERNNYPIIDSKLNLLDLPSRESERNKQVFALLVGGTFIPENPNVADGSSSDNFATTAARNSVNAIMTQQLNKLTGQYIQGLDVDLGVNTFDDYASGNTQTRTQLDVKVSKNLFNDRVSAEMESHIDLDGSVQTVAGQNTAGMTEFAVTYNLTEVGNYRIKAFRENAYDLFDGEIQNSGIAFIFIREFDSFRRQPSKSKIADDKEKNSGRKAKRLE